MSLYHIVKITIPRTAALTLGARGSNEGRAQKKKGTSSVPISLWVDGFNSFVSK